MLGDVGGVDQAGGGAVLGLERALRGCEVEAYLSSEQFSARHSASEAQPSVCNEPHDCTEHFSARHSASTPRAASWSVASRRAGVAE